MKLFLTIFLAIVCAAAVVLGFLHFQSKHEARVQDETAETRIQTAISQQAQACVKEFQDDSSTDSLRDSVRQQVLDVRHTYVDLFSKLATVAKNALSTHDFASARIEENALIDQINARGIEAHTEAMKVGHERDEYDGASLENAQHFNDEVISVAAPDIHRR